MIAVDPETVYGDVDKFENLYLKTTYSSFFHNSRLIRWIQLSKNTKILQTWLGIEPRLLA